MVRDTPPSQSKKEGKDQEYMQLSTTPDTGYRDAPIHEIWDAYLKQVAQWATIAHHGASIMFGDTIIYDAQRQVTRNLKQ